MSILVSFILDLASSIASHLSVRSLEGILSKFRSKNATTEPDIRAKVYLKRFTAVPRAPIWDPEVLDERRIRATYICVGHRPSDAELADLAVSPDAMLHTKPKTVSTTAFLHQLLSVSGALPTAKIETRAATNVFVIVGRPASGKSILSLQLAQHLALMALQDKSFPLPVYVNLKYYINSYSFDLAGFEQLVHHSIYQNCPRDLLPTISPEFRQGFDESIRYVSESSRDVKLFYFFDGLDEMPVHNSYANEQNRRLAAITDFIRSRGEHVFLVTCRIDDYLMLQDYSIRFRMRKFVLLPWTEDIFRKYLAVRRPENPEGLKQIETVILHRIKSDLWRHFAQSPLMAALIFLGGARGKPPQSPSEVWETFIELSFSKDSKYQQLSKSIIDDLSRFAFEQTLYPSKPLTLSVRALNFAQNAGLLRPGNPNPTFEIRSLQHYFTARFMWHQIGLDISCYDGLELTHAKMEVTFVLLAQMAGEDKIFTKFLRRTLLRPGPPREYAQRLRLLGRCIAAQQLKCSSELQADVIEVLELVLDTPDAGALEFAIEGIGNLPEMISLSEDRMKDLRFRTRYIRDLEFRRKSFHVATSRLVIAWRCRAWLKDLIWSFLRDARLGPELIALIDRWIEAAMPGYSWPLARLLPRAGRVACSAATIYGVYMVSLYMAFAAMIWSLKLLGFHTTPLEQPSLVPHSWVDWTARLLFVIVATALPWRLAVGMARSGYGLQSPLSRISAVALSGALLRYSLLLPIAGIYLSETLVLLLDPIVAILLIFGATLLWLGPILFVLIALIRRGKRSQTPTEETALASLDLTNPMFRVYVPPSRRLRTLLHLITTGARSHMHRRYARRLLLTLATLTVAVVTLAAYGLVKVALLLAIGATLLFMAKTLWLNPFQEYIMKIRQIEKAQIAGLQANFDHALDGIIRDIICPDTMNVMRILFIKLLAARVRWDRTLIDRFAKLAYDPALPESVRSYAQVVLARKEKEYEQNTNPRC